MIYFLPDSGDGPGANFGTKLGLVLFVLLPIWTQAFIWGCVSPTLGWGIAIAGFLVYRILVHFLCK